jgi:phosphomannomutase
MALITSISGIRGTIGGAVGEALTPVDIIKFTAAYGTWLKSAGNAHKVVLGRDARISGDVVSKLVTGTLQGLGLDVVDLGMATTPTVEVAVVDENAGGGIILSASHNPIQWNALKLLNEKGEFISHEAGETVLKIAKEEAFRFAEVLELGKYEQKTDWLQRHINKVCAMPLVNVEAIKKANFKIAVDAVNSVGGFAVPAMLEALGVTQIEKLHCDPTGHFAHNPEPLPENITEICEVVKNKNCDLGIIVDPDVDRLALVCDNGQPFGEEYTLVAVADYVLPRRKGALVTNLSSSQAIADMAKKHGFSFAESAVGEVNVVNTMKANNAVIGGEGNGGIIDPELHYGRDSLVGIALFLSHLATSGMTSTELRATYPDYFMVKNKIQLTDGVSPEAMLELLKNKFSDIRQNTVDGLKLYFETGWVLLRKSNTEPIIRVYSEAGSMDESKRLNQLIFDAVA